MQIWIFATSYEMIRLNNLENKNTELDGWKIYL